MSSAQVASRVGGDMLSPKTPACRLCGHRDHWLGEHIAEVHGVSIEEYLKEYPGAPLASEEAVAQLQKTGAPVAFKHPPHPGKLSTTFAGIRVSVNADVPESACLPLPKHYRVPQYGELAVDIVEATIAFAKGRSVYIWSMPGSGKDAHAHAFSAQTRSPAKMFQVQPAADIQAWFFSCEFDQHGTRWEEGELLKALRDGYVSPFSGRRIPYLILISDFDRATKEQAEALRLVMDSIEGRVMGPRGVVYSVLPGTRIIVTANTTGAGDARGRCTSANVVDASILDRFERAYEFHWMDWQDEEIIVKAKFPLLVERCPGVFSQAGKVTGALRAAIKADDLFAEFSHRGLCSWLGAGQDIVEITDKVPPDLLKRALRAVTDKMSDAETRDNAIRIADPHLTGGTVPTGGAPMGRGAPGTNTRI